MYNPTELTDYTLGCCTVQSRFLKQPWGISIGKKIRSKELEKKTHEEDWEV